MFPNKSWDWNGLSQNINISYEDVIDNPHIKWDWSGLSHNGNIPIQTLLKKNIL